MRRASLLLFAVGSLSLRLAAGENWPQFRGPGARGISDSSKLPLSWSATENVAWKTPIPGSGWSSPVVWGDRVFLGPGGLARWLKARGVGYSVWAERHPPADRVLKRVAHRAGHK